MALAAWSLLIHSMYIVSPLNDGSHPLSPCTIVATVLRQSRVFLGITFPPNDLGFFSARDSETSTDR